MAKKIFLTVLLLGVLGLFFWAYWPALQHIPKQDQVSYLSTLAKDEGFFAIMAKSYSYPRKTYPQIADVLLFRPLMDCFLGMERYLFGYNFFLWQLTGVLIHLGTTIALGILLWTIFSGWAAVFFSVFFSFLLVNAPMVNWSNTNAYMIFAGLFLCALRELFLFDKQGGTEVFRVMRAGIFMLFAVFFYEAGVPFALLMTVSLIFTARRNILWRSVGWMLMPVVLYLALSALDFYSLHVQFQANHEGALAFQKVFSWQTFLKVAQALKWFIFGGFFLSSQDIAEDVRTFVFPDTLQWGWPFLKVTPSLIRGLLYFLVGAIVLKVGFNKGWFSRRRAFFYLLLSCVFFYVFTIVCGRVNSRGDLFGLLANVYYFYNFWVIFTVLIFVAVDWSVFQRHWVWKKYRIVFLTIGILGIGTNAIYVRNVNAVVLEKQKFQKHLLAYVDRFVGEHKKEPDFSFYLPFDCPGSMPEWAPGDIEKKASYVSWLYPKYFNVLQPKYILQCPAD